MPLILRDKLSARFFLVYLSFFVCIALILVPIYSVAYSLYADNCVRTSEEMLRNGLNELEGELKNLHLAVLELLEDSALKLLVNQRAAPDSSQYYRVIKAQELFSRAMLYRGVSQDSGLILPCGILLTPERIFHTGESMYGRYLAYEGYADYAQWHAVLSGFQGMETLLPVHQVSGDKGQYQALTYVFWPTTATVTIRNLLFYATFDESYLRRKLQFDNADSGSTLTLYSLDGRLLYASHDMPRQGDRLIEVVSVQCGVRAVVGLNSDQFSKELAPFLRLVVGSAVTLLILGLLLTLIYSYRAFVPVRSMLRTVKRINPTLRPPEKKVSIKGEYETIQNFLEHADSAFSDYKNALMHQNEQLRSMTLQQLVLGQVHTQRALQRAQSYFPNFPPQYYLVITRPEFESDVLLEDVSSSLLLMASVAQTIFEEEALVQTMRDLLILIVDARMGRDVLSTKLIALHDKVLALAQIDSMFTVSDVTCGMEHLDEAFLQAHNLRRRKLAANEGVLLYESSLSERETVWVDGNRFYELVMRSQEAAAIAQVRQTLQELKDAPNVSEEMIRCAYYTYLSVMTRIRGEMHYADLAEAPPMNYRPYHDLDARFESILDETRRLCGQIQTYFDREKTAFAQELAEYIQRNLEDPDMTAWQVAEHHGISEARLQRVLQQQVGKRFFDYLDGARMARAHELVRTTDLKLHEVMLKCGYTQRNTFYKAFKRTYGISPSELRKHPQAAQDE